MHARVSTYQSPPEQLTDAVIEQMKADVLPRLFSMDGNRGAIYLVDRGTGKAMTITLWDSEDALHASEEVGSALRGSAAEATSGSVGTIERYEAPITEVR